MRKENKMKKVGLFLILVLFSTKSDAVCSLPADFIPKPACQIAEGTFKNGEVVYKQSYCKGDFPYCETWSGNCCSDPSYVSDDGAGCCNPEEYVAHRVASINPGGTALSVGGYKCCSIAGYGKNSTYYFDKEEHVHCCGGKVYQAKSNNEEKSCCNPEFDSEGNIRHYHTVVSVIGAPEGETNQICCKAIGEAPGKYRAMAYWNGSSAQCCDGTTYKTGVDDAGLDTYSCCSGTRGPKEDRTNGVVSVLGAPNGEQACCGYYEEKGENGIEKNLGTAYWDGNSPQCCSGTVYKTGVDDNGKEVYSCCTNEKKICGVKCCDACNKAGDGCCEREVCGEGENKKCCFGDQICVDGECKCPDENPNECGEACCELCNEAGDGCCEREVCGEGEDKKCCSGEQTCVDGECKCPDDKPNECGEKCCKVCNPEGTGCCSGSGYSICNDSCCKNGETCFEGACMENIACPTAELFFRDDLLYWGETCVDEIACGGTIVEYDNWEGEVIGLEHVCQCCCWALNSDGLGPTLQCGDAHDEREDF